MKNTRDQEKKVVGFNILEEECVWMKSGLVSFKRCENAYDCNNCQYDKAMTAAVKSAKEGAPAKPSFREKAKLQSYMERECRHMMSGRVAVRKCGNDYRCDVCDFDQSMDEIDSVYPIGLVPIVEVNGYRYSDSYYYHRGHAWARVEYGGRARIGLDDFALKLLGRPDRLELPGPGRHVSRDEPFFALMREGHAADVLAPTDGTVLAINYEALERPGSIHDDPYGKGWLMIVEPSRLKKNLETLYFGETGKNWLDRECGELQNLVMSQYGAMAATGAPPVDDLFGFHPEIGWSTLVKRFLKTG
jgi:glycine cleavage system H lipoate-binding protein